MFGIQKTFVEHMLKLSIKIVIENVVNPFNVYRCIIAVL